MAAVVVAGLEGQEEKLVIATVPPAPEDYLQIGLPADIQSLFDLENLTVAVPVEPVPSAPEVQLVDHPPNQTTDTAMLPTLAVEDSDQAEQGEEKESEDTDLALAPTLAAPPPTQLDSLVPPTSEHDEFDVSWNELLPPLAPAPTAIAIPPARAPTPSPLVVEAELLAPTVESDSEDEGLKEAPLPLDSLPNLPPMQLTWQPRDSDLASAFPSSDQPPSQRLVADLVNEFESLVPASGVEEEDKEEPPSLPPPPPPLSFAPRGPRRKGGGRPPDA